MQQWLLQLRPWQRFRKIDGALQRWWFPRSRVEGWIVTAGILVYPTSDTFLDEFYRELFSGLPILPSLAWLWGGVTFVEFLLLSYRVPRFLHRRFWLFE